MASEHPFLPLQDVAAAVGVEAIHSSIVGRRLKEKGLKTYKPSATLDLSEKNRADRLLFANEMMEGQVDWANVIFTDEKIFRTDATCPVNVRRPKGARHHTKYTIKKDSSGRKSVHVWGWVDGHGCGEIHRIEGRHTAETYVSILGDVLLPTLEAMRPGGVPYTFQQDNAPQHTARATKQWFHDNQDRITLLGWPGKSPDLNIIEHVWATMTREIGEDLANIRHVSAEDLWRRIQEKWENLRTRTSYFRVLAESMQRRLATVVDEAGGPTPY